jgi:hypothetical protein
MQKLARTGAVAASLIMLAAAAPATADGGATPPSTDSTPSMGSTPPASSTEASPRPRTPEWPAGEKALGRAPAASAASARPAAGAASGEPAQAVEPDDWRPDHRAWVWSIWNSP